MAVFTYKALSGSRDVAGTIAADSPRQARAMLGERGLIVRDIVDFKASTSHYFKLRLPLTRAVSRLEITEFFRELATLLSVGLPLLEALSTLGRQHTNRARDSITLLHDRVAGGASLATALGEQPRMFDDLAINIVEIGEDAGTLDRSLERLAEFREKADQLRGKLATALIYPAIVSVVGLACSLFLMTFVVPKILQPLIEQNLPLPFPTRVVKSISDGLLDWWWLLGLLGGAVFGSLAYALSTENGQRAWNKLELRLPVIGDLTRKQIVARVATVISTLLRSGIPLPRALEIARRAASNRVLADALAASQAQITAGHELSAALENTAVFPPMVVQVFALGQHSGKLEDMLDRLAAAYEVQVNTATARLIALLEPAMIVVLAGFVLFIVLATVLPILEAGNAIQ